MGSLNSGVTLTSPYSPPTATYTVSASVSRVNNSTVRVTYTVTPRLSSPQAYLLDGIQLDAVFNANGTGDKYIRLKDSGTEWRGISPTSAKTGTFDIASSSAGTVNVSCRVDRSGTFAGTPGRVPAATHTLTMPALLLSACTAPTSRSASPNPFTSAVSLSWSGAGGGTNNGIVRYELQYRTSSNNSNWSGWTSISNVNTSSGSGSTSHTPSVANGTYVQYQIRTVGSQGTGYASGWAQFSSVRKIPYTACGAPTSLSASPTIFEGSVSLSWSGAASGTNNTISSYEIQYRTSANGSTWRGWAALTTVSTTSGSGSTSMPDPAGKVGRGDYVQFQIRTRGSAGSSYYSGWRQSGSIRRNSLPTAPTVFSASKSVYNQGDSITLSWSGASDVNNNIARYAIEYRVMSGSAWGAWSALTTVSTASTSGSLAVTPTQAPDWGQIQYRIKTVDALSTESGYRESAAIRRDDDTGLKFGVGPEWRKMYLDFGINGAWRRVKISFGSSEVWAPGKDLNPFTIKNRS